MTKHIGIVACSAEGAALCYRTICLEGADLMGEYAHPEVSMHTFPLNRYMRYFESNDWQGVADLMLASAARLAKAGADFAICPDNTIHQSFDLVVKKSPIPWLHIAEEVAAEAKRQNYKRLGVLGTRSLMESTVYPTQLTAVGIEQRTPELKDRERIDGIIFKELINGRFTAEARAYFSEVISQLKNQGCDAVVLGCTEIPLLATRESSPLPTLDSTRLLARAALKKAVGR
ncbi:MAG: amino acid racemase [Dehalococcoidia bacterium]|jgi:aspartate racemase